MRKKNGFAAVMMTLSLTAMLGVLGFVTDIGWAYFRKQAAQTASEAAMLAATSYAAANGLVCGQSGVVCQSTPTSCSSISGSGSLSVACQYAAANGYTDGANNRSVTVSSGTGSPPGTSGVTTDYWVQANVGESLPLLFSAVLGHNTFQVNTKVTATATAGSGPGSIIVLGSGPGTVTTDGSTSLNSASDIFVNSNDNAAVQLSGTDAVAVSGGHCVHVVGSCQRNGSSTISPAPVKMTAALPDPYTKMQPPNDGGCTLWGTQYFSGSHTLNPGNYCEDIDVGGTATVTFRPGTYILHGDVNFTSGTATGSGVTMYVKTGQCSMSGGTINLSAPTTGNYKGVTIYQPSSNTHQCTLKAGTSQKISGLVYAPTATVSHCGGSAASAPDQTIVCKKIAFSGGTNVNKTATTIYTATKGMCQ